MSQLAGKRVQDAQYSFISAQPSDHQGNASLQVTLGGVNKSRQIVVGNVSYVGEAAPGTGYDEPKWKMTKVNDINGDGSDIETSHAYIPASGSVPAIYSGFDHIFNDYATLTYDESAVEPQPE